MPVEQAFATLGLPSTATLVEVTTAYRRAALLHHPDKGGDEQTFKAILSAKDHLVQYHFNPAITTSPSPQPPPPPPQQASDFEEKQTAIQQAFEGLFETRP